MIFTPYGQPGDNIEKMMLLSMWAHYLKKQEASKRDAHHQLILAGIGKPSYPINRHTVRVFKDYWENIEACAEKWHQHPDLENDECAIGYGDPYGDDDAKKSMAQAMSAWYGFHIAPDNVLFTVGGIGGLHIIFDVLNSFYAQKSPYRVITPFPHYSAYSNNSRHLLHPVDVMSEPGYQLTARALEKSIQHALELAKIDAIPPKAVLICNPSNPLGTIIKQDELLNIASVLRCYPDLHIIFDEAYAEMTYKELPSFLALAPDLKKRTILLRSATKALSAAGERMAVILAFDDYLMSELVRQQIVSYVHPPRSAQIAYAKTMLHLTLKERHALCAHYHDKVTYVLQRLKDMGAQMPSARYHVDATFYVLGDFSDMLGTPMPQGLDLVFNKKEHIQTGEDLAYALLFRDSLMLAPLSYFGLNKDCGYLRITCSGKFAELKEMMDRLELRLQEARVLKNQALMDSLLKVNRFNDSSFLRKKEEFLKITEKNRTSTPSCLDLKEQNNQLVLWLKSCISQPIIKPLTV